MASIDERVVILEGRAEGQGHMINGIREAVARLEVRIASLETRMDQRLLAFEAESRSAVSKLRRAPPGG